MMLGSFESYSNSALNSSLAVALLFFTARQCLIEEPWPEPATVANGSNFDFIIVGSGTAGSTLAARLAEVYQVTVLLVEAGGFPPKEAIIPGFRDTLKGSSYDWHFRTVNDGISSQGLEGGRQIQPRGKMLGGSGSMNDMVYSRGCPEDYEEWVYLTGDSSWSWTNVLQYFKRTENMTDERIINSDELMKFHGREGEIEVSGRSEFSLPTSKFLEAFKELGFNLVDDMTNPYEMGAGRFSHTIRNGRRDSSVTALLNNVKTEGLYVLNDTLVTKVLIENSTAIGIRALLNGEEMDFYAHKEVIISAGTFNSPKLLMLSGIGPKDHLDELGIEVVQDLAVGENLHDHVMVLNYLTIEPGTCTLDKSAEYLELFQYLYNSSGILSYSDSMGVYMPKTGGDRNIPHFAIYPTCIPVGVLTVDKCINILGYCETVCDKLTNANQRHELISLAVVLLKPQSRGKVRLNSTDPIEDPLIYSGTFRNSVDFEGYNEAIKMALSLVNTTYFKGQGASILDYRGEKCSELNDGEDRIRKFVKDYALPAWHAVGTAAMGSVLDPDLSVKGVKDLRVVDASVIPTVIRGNTNAAVVMIAEKAADNIKAKYNLDRANCS